MAKFAYQRLDATLFKVYRNGVLVALMERCPPGYDLKNVVAVEPVRRTK